MIRPWRTWPATSSGRLFPRKECSIWMKRERSFINPRMARIQRFFPLWNGWRRCVRTSRISGEQMVRYYGYYSNVSRGKRQKEGLDDAIPCIMETQGNKKAFRKNWSSLIQKIYEVDPLVCPKCQGKMRIISFIEDPSVIRDILNHLGLWLVKARPPPKAHVPSGGA